MIVGQLDKTILITPPAAKLDDASATTAAIDTAGADYVVIDVILGDTDIAMAALKVQESDTDGSYVDVPGLVYGTSAGISGTTSTLPSATDDNKVYTFEIDMRGRKRWLDLVATAGNGSTGTFLCAVARLYRHKDQPVSATERGRGNILRV